MRNHRGLRAAIASLAMLAAAANAADTAAADTAKVPKDATTRGVMVLKPAEPDEPVAEMSTTPASTKADPVSTRTDPAPSVPAPATVKVSTKPSVPAISSTPPKAPSRPKPPVLVAPVIKSCGRPFAQPDLTLASAKRFNKELGARLRRGGRVVVDLPQPYAETADAPAALSPWFAQVQAAGGSVSLKHYCMATRGFGNWLKSIFKRDPAKIYRAADNYNVLLHSDGLDQRVTQVEFVPKGTS